MYGYIRKLILERFDILELKTKLERERMTKTGKRLNLKTRVQIKKILIRRMKGEDDP